ncbi:NUDIX domain-containing protein [Marivivens donghaensis]|uniref:NUDIX domain-containing protein n=1 Tax=Marivivens donghaensis TaxID=1699413 RepID=A0ABX0VUW0_9RHOB|nr:NUDIX domain-containing protein [Marivivens donghaensis]
MTTWRPSPRIRFKALGLHWREGKLLASEVLGDDGNVKGVRPLGGSVEFGETAEEAVVREFREELDLEVKTHGPALYLENIYTHEGSLGHEVVALFEVTFTDAAFAGETRIEFRESDGSSCFAEWFDLEELDLLDGPRLYPNGLKALLAGSPKRQG